jgi:hypothetical protein
MVILAIPVMVLQMESVKGLATGMRVGTIMEVAEGYSLDSKAVLVVAVVMQDCNIRSRT